MTQEASESAAIFLFLHFKDSHQVTSVDTKILKNTFGPFPSSAASNSCEIVQKLVRLLPEDAFEKLEGKTGPKRKRYGHKLKIDVEDTSSVPVEESDSDDDIDKGETFLNQFKEQLAIDQTKRGNELNIPVSRNKQPSNQNTVNDDTSWLLNQCQKYFPNQDSPETMATALYDVLSSKKNDAEIQNELFELVGFEAIDLIGQLLKRRKELVSGGEMTNGFGGDQGIFWKKNVKKPFVGSQVTIQVGFAAYIQ